MFYLLNFRTHRFQSCDTVEDVYRMLHSNMRNNPNLTEKNFEVINCFPDGIRYTLEEFKENFKGV